MTYCTVSDVAAILNITIDANSSPTANAVNDMIAFADSFIDAVSGHDWNSTALANASAEVHDGYGYGPRAGMILLKHFPVLSVDKVYYWKNSTDQWVLGVEGRWDEHPADETYLVYLDEARIQWNKLRKTDSQCYKAEYTYGYNPSPGYVKRISALLTALEVLRFRAGAAQSDYSVGGATVKFAEGWKYGKQEKMILDEVNYQLKFLQRPRLQVY